METMGASRFYQAASRRGNFAHRTAWVSADRLGQTINNRVVEDRVIVHDNRTQVFVRSDKGSVALQREGETAVRPVPGSGPSSALRIKNVR